MRLYLDEDINPKIAEILQRSGCNAVSTQGAGNRGADDEAQLVYASRIDAALVTRNRNDFIALTTQFLDEGRKHSGVIIVPHSVRADDPTILARLLARFTSRHPEDLPQYAVIFLTQRPG